MSVPVTSLQLCVLGLLAGIIAGTVIIAFRGLIMLWHEHMLGGMANYVNLTANIRLLLPIVCVILILAVASLTGFKHYRLGIPFVIHRLKMFYGHIPFASSINQFFGGILALGSGFVVGKEGPTVHLAAAAGHYIGRWLRLPFNSLRIIAGCGIAAGIAAAFNTPFAAVIFVMEVVLRDYKVHVFIPIMLAAACGSLMTRMVFGDIYELSFISFSQLSGFELLSLVVMGIGLGFTAYLFNATLMAIMKLFRPVNMFVRLLLAGTITGIVGYFLPEALGADFSNVRDFLDAEPNIQMLILICASKLFLASVAIALGIPGGIIGSVMVIGMLLGVIFMIPLGEIVDTASTSSYALLGLAGFLASVLFAPMAALSAAMELAADSTVVLPAIIVIVTACVTSKQLCANRSIFIQQLDFQQLAYTTSAVRDWLQQTGVLALLDPKVTLMQHKTDEEITTELANNNDVVINHRVDANTMRSIYEWVSLSVSLNEDDPALSKQQAIILTQQHTLADVYDALHTKRQGAVIIIERLPDSDGQFVSIDEVNEFTNRIQNIAECHVLGVVTWNALHSYLLRKQH